MEFLPNDDLVYAEAAEFLHGSSVARTAEPGNWRKLAFYNIGWAHTSKKHTKKVLTDEIMTLVAKKDLDAIGISEVFNLKDDVFHAERQSIMEHLLGALNGSAAQPAWAGRCDGHYIFIWDTMTLHLNEYEFIGCGIAEHPWRRAQYMQFKYPDLQNGPLLHLLHRHSPSSENTKFTSSRRSFFFAFVESCA